jgi:uncharacterized ion transporter superfamily protein YfcC
MNQQAGIRISQRMFVQSLVILFLLMIAAGVLTRVIPAGQYARVAVGGRETIDPASFQLTARPDYPIWRWFTAPIEVLGAPGNMTLIVIILFLLFIGGSFAVLEKSGLVHGLLARITGRFGKHKYALLLVVSFVFMLMGAFFGIFEETVPLVPVAIALAYSLGWDALTGLAMSILAVNLGFSAAVTNPFTLGVAQELAGLPLFSGAGLRVVIFLVVYTLFAVFIVRYARRIERNPRASPLYETDGTEREKYRTFDAGAQENPRLGAALAWFGAVLLLILAVLFSGPFLPAVSDYALPIVGVLFLVAGVGAGLIAGAGRKVWPALGQGMVGILPAIPLILMAVSVKHIVTQGNILDTILHWAAVPLSSASPFAAALLVYGLALVIEVFIASGSAKAFLIMPILLPLAELLGVTRQVTVLAYCFGDGFSNLVYPTNPVLLICLGLATVGYTRWLKWSLPLWLVVIAVTVAFLGLAVAIGYGPF